MSIEFPVSTDNYLLNATSDLPDLRDLLYQPALTPVKDFINPPDRLVILDQGQEGACTGFGLAAAINHLYQRVDKEREVSPRMLYEMARKFDEWEGEDYSGSSCRGAMRGWQNMGACATERWPYRNGHAGELTVDRAKDARNTTPGAYYRVSKRMEDYHTALNEVGVIYTSAHVHGGWNSSQMRNGIITHHPERTGGHAFAIVGYNSKGFWIQNSWSRRWGNDGVALWSYQDWHENISDAWVVQLAAPTPKALATSIFRGDTVASQGRSQFGLFKSPQRGEIAGHFVHIDDGKFHTKQKYFSTLADVEQTAQLIDDSEKYQHMVFYAHGGLNSPKASAMRIAAMKETFKANGIYPYHFMYDTGVLEELKDIVLRRGTGGEDRAKGFFDGLIDHWDRALENATRVPGRALWREMKSGAKLPFKSSMAGSKTLQTLIPVAKDKGLKIHVVGHSTGAILLAHLLNRLQQQQPQLKIASCSLMAPACTLKDFEDYYAPLLDTANNEFGIEDMAIYNLSDDLELDDTVGSIYRKSLLYLVSKSFEEKRPEAILGMQLHNGDISQKLILNYSKGKKGNKITQSTSHGGFDNDPATMNNILNRILGKKPKFPFTKINLDY